MDCIPRCAPLAANAAPAGRSSGPRVPPRCRDLLNATREWVAAEEHCRLALVVAEWQSIKTFELRAATRLACLWRDQGKRSEARDFLAPIYGWFTEGFDTPVLQAGSSSRHEAAGAVLVSALPWCFLHQDVGWNRTLTIA